jgi:hypothetical protein
MLLSPSAATFDAPAFASFPAIPSDRQVVWTDRRCDLFSVLRPIRWSDFVYASANDDH